jgi:hypothetical protein
MQEHKNKKMSGPDPDKKKSGIPTMYQNKNGKPSFKGKKK